MEASETIRIRSGLPVFRSSGRARLNDCDAGAHRERAAGVRGRREVVVDGQGEADTAGILHE